MEKNKGENRIKRRSFLYYIGAFAVGVVAFSRKPLKFISTNLNLPGSKTPEGGTERSSIKVKPNPDAVRRKNG